MSKKAAKTYRQDFCKVLTAETGLPGDGRIDALALAGGDVWAVVDGRLGRVADDEFQPAAVHERIFDVVESAGILWAVGEDFVARVDGGELKRKISLPSRSRSCAPFRDGLAIALGRQLFFAGEDRLESLGEIEQEIRCVAASADGDRLAAATADGVKIWREGEWTDAPVDPPTGPVNALLWDTSGHLWIGTDKGLVVAMPPVEARWIRGWDGLPCEQISCLAEGDDGGLWVGSPIGLARLFEGQWRFYPCRRWIAAREVTCIAADEGGDAWIGTAAGLSHIWWETMTLERKALRYEEQVAARHNRLGYVTICMLERPGDLSKWTHEASDNDGLWTAIYTAAECFRYGATGDPSAEKLARRSMEALLFLEEVTPIEGHVARAVVRKDEKNVVQSGGEWHESEDGQWLWKGDTSSDEIDGHFFIFGVYADLVATPGEKKRIAATAARIMKYIVKNNYLLIDVDGERTTWGVWNPEMLNSKRWWEEKGLNSLEVLSYLKTTYRLTGDPEFERLYRELIEAHGYMVNALHQKITMPGHINHSDDELAFLAYFNLIRYETDPRLRRLLLASFERSWRIERPERVPPWNLIYGALTGHPCDVDEAVEELRNIPVDLIRWPIDNSGRADLEINESEDRFGHVEAKQALRAHERGMLKWNGNPYQLNRKGRADHEEDAAFFLFPYWLGRYCGLIDE